MSDYISREAAIKKLDHFQSHLHTVDGTHAIGVAKTLIKELPAADVRPVVRGKWIDDKGNPVPWDVLEKGCPAHSCYCSVCGDWLSASDEYPVKGYFCPNCGADMREES